MYSQKIIYVLVSSLFLYIYSSYTYSDDAKLNLYDVYQEDIVSNDRFTNRFDYNEAEVRGEFISPGGKKYHMSGFYDGVINHDHTWRVRFMPNQNGIWEYTIFFNNELTKKGQLSVSNKPGLISNHGHIKIDPEYKKSLVYEDGTPHYWIGGKWISALTYGPHRKENQVNKATFQGSGVSFGRKSDDEILRYLSLLEKYRHNGLLIKIALFPLEKDKISWDLVWIKRAEWIVRECLKRGIIVQINIFDTWSRNAEYWFKESDDGTMHVFNVWEDDDDKYKLNYIRTVISRFASFPNIYWELGNEMEHNPNCGECFIKISNEKYIPWIKKYDPYSLPIGLSEHVWFNTNVDIGFIHQTTQLPKEEWTKPVIMNELVQYIQEPTLIQKLRRKLFGYVIPEPEGLWHHKSINDPKLRFVYRKTFWKVFTYGGTGSSEATWLEIDKPFSKAVQNVMNDHMNLANLLNGFINEINSMLLIKGVVVNGPGDVSTRARTGIRYVTYFDIGKDKRISTGTLSIILPKGSYKGRWFRPRQGDYIEVVYLKSNGREMKLSYPSFQEDIVLLLERGR